jgi:hypothetical protein
MGSVDTGRVLCLGHTKRPRPGHPLIVCYGLLFRVPPATSSSFVLFALIVCRATSESVLSACDVQEDIRHRGTMPIEQSALEPTALQ